jgi:hypothetical protein
MAARLEYLVFTTRSPENNWVSASHFTQALAGLPGRAARNGKPCEAGSGSPRHSKARKFSSACASARNGSYTRYRWSASHARRRAEDLPTQSRWPGSAQPLQHVPLDPRRLRPLARRVCIPAHVFSAALAARLPDGTVNSYA